MNVRTLRIALLCFAVASAAAGIMAVVLATAMPLSIASATDSASKTGAVAGSQVRALKATPLFADVAEVDLRRPLVDGPLPVALPVAASVESPVAVPSIRLLGTMIEPGHSMGLFADATGKCEFKSVGDVVDGAKIVEIRDSVATVIWNDSRIELAIPRDTATVTSAGSAGTASVMGATSDNVTSVPMIANSPPDHSRAPVLEMPTDEKEMRAFLNRKPTLEDN